LVPVTPGGNVPPNAAATIAAWPICYRDIIAGKSNTLCEIEGLEKHQMKQWKHIVCYIGEKGVQKYKPVHMQLGPRKTIKIKKLKYIFNVMTKMNKEA
jgi:hypothetical protein